MPRMQLTVDSMGQSQSMAIVHELINEGLRAMARDCIDRPGCKDKRTVNFKVHGRPVISPQGVCEGVTLQFTCNTSLPLQKTREFDADVQGNGVLVINDASPENRKQMTLDEAEE